MDEVCLILQPKAAIREDVQSAVASIRNAGIDLRVRMTWDAQDFGVVVREAITAGARRIIAGGGDGTVNALVNAIGSDAELCDSLTLGVLPLGTANDFARGIELPSTDLAECLNVACLGPSKRVDLGQMNDRYFLNVASLGFGAEITSTTPLPLKKALGGGAYTLMGLATALRFVPYSGTLFIPGQEPQTGDIILGAVANSCYAGGGFNVAPLASMSDGLLDLALIRHRPDIDISRALKELESPFDKDNQYLQYLQLPEFTLECPAALHCNLDGEPIQDTRMCFNLLRERIQLAVPDQTAPGTAPL